MEKNTTPDMTADHPQAADADAAPAEELLAENQEDRAKKPSAKTMHKENDDEMVLSSLISVNDDELSFSGKALVELVKGTTIGEKFRNNWGFFLCIVILVLIYVALGYITRAEMIENDRLNKEVLDWRYKALTRSSELRERTLRSNIEDRLPDSTLCTPTESPYELTVNKEDDK